MEFFGLKVLSFPQSFQYLTVYLLATVRFHMSFHNQWLSSIHWFMSSVYP